MAKLIKDKSKQQVNKPILPAPNVEAEDTSTVIQEPLMPELELLVKKNPNRLLGCGG